MSDDSLINALACYAAKVAISPAIDCSKALATETDPLQSKKRTDKEIVQGKDAPVVAELVEEKDEEYLNRWIILKYMSSDMKHASAWIDAQPNEKNKEYLHKRLLELHADWRDSERQLDLKEQYEIFRRPELSIYREIPTFHAKKGKNRFISHPKIYTRIEDKATFNVRHNTVRIIQGAIKPNLIQAREMPDDLVNYLHYKPTKENPNQKDTKSRVDLRGSEAGGELVWFGPNHPFKVIRVYIHTTDEDKFIPEYNDLPSHGTCIYIEVLPKDNNINKHKLSLMHFTTIHRDIYEGEGKIFEEGTFLGMTIRKIGRTTGPHLHVDSGDEKFTRDKIYTLWTGKDTKKKP